MGPLRAHPPCEVEESKRQLEETHQVAEAQRRLRVRDAALGAARVALRRERRLAVAARGALQRLRERLR